MSRSGWFESESGLDPSVATFAGPWTISTLCRGTSSRTPQLSVRRPGPAIRQLRDMILRSQDIASEALYWYNGALADQYQGTSVRTRIPRMLYIHGALCSLALIR
jgi:hypothetical protein